MSEETELKPCPFCGPVGEDFQEPVKEGKGDNSRVRCQCCGVKLSWRWKDDPCNAEVLWNKRPAEDELTRRLLKVVDRGERTQKKIEQLREALGAIEGIAELGLGIAKKGPILERLRARALKALEDNKA